MHIKIKHPGALTRKAAAAGESIPRYAQEHEHTPGPTGVQSRLYDNVFHPANEKRAALHRNKHGA
jgi:hypothetical protein